MNCGHKRDLVSIEIKWYVKTVKNKRLIVLFILVDYIKYRAVDTALGEWNIVC